MSRSPGKVRKRPLTASLAISGRIIDKELNLIRAKKLCHNNFDLLIAITYFSYYTIVRRPRCSLNVWQPHAVYSSASLAQI